MCFLTPFVVYAQVKGYSCQRKINKPVKAGFYSVRLSPELMSQLKSGWNDIRILDFANADTLEVPYLWETTASEYQQKIIPFELINATYDASYSYLTLKVDDEKIINHISLDITDPDFDKWVRVEGSNDNKAWFTICERLRIVRFQNTNEHFEYTSLDFPNAQYAYFRLKFDNTSSPKLNISKVLAFETERKDNRTFDELKVSSWKQTENKKEKQSEIIVELPVAYRISHIDVKSAGNKDFYRTVNVYRSSTVHTTTGDKEVWYMLNTGVFSSAGNTQISCLDAQTKKLKIEILNNDDQPIEIKEVKAFAEQLKLVAELPVSDNLYLLYNKANDNAPVYDLVHFKEKIPAIVTEIACGPEQAFTPLLEAKSPLVSSKSWLWAAMGGIMVVIAFFSFRLLKKQSSD